MQALLLRLRTRWTAAAAHYAEAHLNEMRSDLRSQADAAAAAAIHARCRRPTQTPDVLWHALWRLCNE
jgi:hypothetical protein